MHVQGVLLPTEPYPQPYALLALWVFFFFFLHVLISASDQLSQVTPDAIAAGTVYAYACEQLGSTLPWGV